MQILVGSLVVEPSCVMLVVNLKPILVVFFFLLLNALIAAVLIQIVSKVD